MRDDVELWLRRGDWPRIQEHFTNNVPRRAIEFAARALMATHAVERTPATVAQLLSDWQEARALEPGNLLHAVNFAQALLDVGRPEQALQVTVDLMRAPGAGYPAAEKHCLALHALARWDEAAQAAALACSLAEQRQISPSAVTSRTYAELASAWWKPLRAGSVLLRLPEAGDTAFIAAAFANAKFMRAFHRYQGKDAHSVRQFIETARLPPGRARRRDWLVSTRGGDAVGFAGIVDLDTHNLCGELLIGIVAEDNVVRAVAPQASLATLVFAFDRLRLEKMVSHVYGDNPAAQANTLHLGFVQEGRLREHLVPEAGSKTRLDLFVNGMLRSDFEANRALARMRKRWHL